MKGQSVQTIHLDMKKVLENDAPSHATVNRWRAALQRSRLVSSRPVEAPNLIPSGQVSTDHISHKVMGGICIFGQRSSDD